MWTAHRYLLFQGNIFSAMSENFCHPDQFADELVGAADIALIQQLSGIVENLVDPRKIHVPKDGNESQFAQNRLKMLDDSRAAKYAGGNTNDTGRLMDVFLKAAVE